MVNGNNNSTGKTSVWFQDIVIKVGNSDNQSDKLFFSHTSICSKCRIKRREHVPIFSCKYYDINSTPIG